MRRRWVGSDVREIKTFPSGLDERAIENQLKIFPTERFIEFDAFKHPLKQKRTASATAAFQ